MSVTTFLAERILPNKGGIHGVAKQTGLSVAVLKAVLRGEQTIDEEIAQKLATLYPETSSGFWINLQANSTD